MISVRCAPSSLKRPPNSSAELRNPWHSTSGLPSPPDEVAKCLAADRDEPLVHHLRIDCEVGRDPGGQVRVKTGRRASMAPLKTYSETPCVVRWRTDRQTSVTRSSRSPEPGGTPVDLEHRSIAEAPRPLIDVALATCSLLPDLDDDERLLIPALAARGARSPSPGLGRRLGCMGCVSRRRRAFDVGLLRSSRGLSRVVRATPSVAERRCR